MKSIKQTIQRLRIKRKINKNLKQNGFDRNDFKKRMIAHRNRDLNIHEILSREYSPVVMVDVYEYCMRKCNWNVSTLQDGAVKDYLLCDLFLAEVEYGGFWQFFSDETGDMAAETVDALKKVDEVYSDTLTKAIQLFPGGTVEKDLEKRIKIMEDFDEKTNMHLAELQRIVSERDHDFSLKLFGYLQEHKNDFLAF